MKLNQSKSTELILISAYSLKKIKVQINISNIILNLSKREYIIVFFQSQELFNNFFINLDIILFIKKCCVAF